MNYNEFISQFPIISNSNISEIRKSLPPGMDYHHITPISYQVRQLGITEKEKIKEFKWSDLCDKRCVMLSCQDHAFAHWLWDREHSERTVRYIRNRTAKIHNISLGEKAFLKMDPEYVYGLFEVLNHIDRRGQGWATKTMWQDPNKKEYIRKKMSLAKQGKVNCCKDRKWIYMMEGDKKVFKRISKEQLDGYTSLGWSVGYKNVTQ